MLRVFHEGDKVILDLCGRRRDVLLSCGQSLQVAESLEARAADCESAESTIIKGEQWGCKVESYDGQIALRFTVPSIGFSGRIPLTAQAARQLAEVIRAKESWARYKMRLVVGGN